IKVSNSDTLIDSLNKVRIRNLCLHANVVRIDRKEVAKASYADVKVVTLVANTANTDHNASYSSKAISYANVAKAPIGRNRTTKVKYDASGDTITPLIELKQTIPTDFPLAILGCYKDFRSIENTRTLCLSEGFLDVEFKYLGGLWVLFEFSSLDARNKFMKHEGILSCMDKAEITRKPSKTGKHGHGKRKSTKEAGKSSQKNDTLAGVKAQRMMGFVLKALTEVAQMSQSRIAKLAIRVRSFAYGRGARFGRAPKDLTGLSLISQSSRKALRAPCFCLAEANCITTKAAADAMWISLMRRLRRKRKLLKNVQQATTQFNKLLSIEDFPQLQALANIASGIFENMNVVIDHGVVPILVKLLASPSDDVREESEDRWDGTDDEINDEESQKEPPLVSTKRPSRTNTRA
ncbi:reverse transcriptase domain, reverse transcriptase zinc-binding domain protein, partial [Tanacetum coccineum]